MLKIPDSYSIQIAKEFDIHSNICELLPFKPYAKELPDSYSIQTLC